MILQNDGAPKKKKKDKGTKRAKKSSGESIRRLRASTGFSHGQDRLHLEQDVPLLGGSNIGGTAYLSKGVAFGLATTAAVGLYLYKKKRTKN